MNGLHACKPGNEPQVGQVKTFLIEKRVGKSGKAYTKIKSAPADQGGLTYRITSATPTGHTDSYGNISFNLDIEPSDGSSAPPQRGASPAPRAASQNGWDDRSSRIERQHSQEMALRYAMLKDMGNIDTHELRELIDWFQKDVGHVPESPSKPEPRMTQNHDIAGEQGSGPPDDDEIPF